MEFCKNCGSISYTVSATVSYKISVDKQDDFELIETDRENFGVPQCSRCYLTMKDIDYDKIPAEKRQKFLEMTGTERIAFLEDLGLLEQQDCNEIEEDINDKKTMEAVQ